MFPPNFRGKYSELLDSASASESVRFIKFYGNLASVITNEIYREEMAELCTYLPGTRIVLFSWTIVQTLRKPFYSLL